MVHLRQVATEEGELFYFIPGARISVSLFPMLQLCQLVTINFLPPPPLPPHFPWREKGALTVHRKLQTQDIFVSGEQRAQLFFVTDQT